MTADLRRLLLTGIMIAVTVPMVQAQVLVPGSIEKTMTRDFSITDSTGLSYINNLDAVQYHMESNNGSKVVWGNGHKTRLSLLSPKAMYEYRSDYPRSYNDGPLWFGKGSTVALTGGGQFRAGPLDVTLMPVLMYSQNASFYMASSPQKNQYSYPFQRNIDYVLRYGDDSFVRLFPGQSDVSLSVKNVRAGISTQNFQWGPSRYNPIILSTQAPGFPHAYIGTDKPAKTAIGEFEVKQFWGRLDESDYFDENSENDYRFISGLSLGYRPKWIPGLNLGFNRVFYKYWNELATEDFFITMYRFTPPSDMEPGGQNDEYDQMASVSARWTFPEVGFEPYFEFAKNDFGGGLFGLQPEHTRAFTLGFTKLFRVNAGHTIAATAEHTTLGQSRSVLVRATPTYYVHSVVDQGYTHQGQILGAGIGPGSHSNKLKLKWYGPDFMQALSVQTIRFDDDYYYATFDDRYHHDLEVTVGYEGSFRLKEYQLGYHLTYSRRSNWYFEEERDVNQFSLGVSFGVW